MVKSWLEGLLPGKAVTRVTRRGTPARWASPAARPWPWRAWVQPASSRARKHLQKNVLGSKAGSQQFETRHRGGSPKRDAAWLGSLYTEQHGSLTSTGKRW
jgi:hypothetical protein